MLIIVMSITDQVIMRQTESLVHFEILYVYSKVSFELLSFLFETSLSPGFGLFCYVLAVLKRTKSSFFWKEKLSRGVFRLTLS